MAIIKATGLFTGEGICHPSFDDSDKISNVHSTQDSIDSYSHHIPNELDNLPFTRTSLLTSNEWSATEPRSSTSKMKEFVGISFILGAGAVLALEASPFLALASLLLLGTSGCQAMGETDISYSAIEFNPTLKADLGPSRSIKSDPSTFMNAQNPNEQKSPFYPMNYLELGKLRNAETLWVSANMMQKQNNWALSWELIVNGFQAEKEGYSFNFNESRSCIPFTHSETGEHMMLSTPHGEEDFTMNAATSLFNFSQYTIGLGVCPITNDLLPENNPPPLGISNDCKSYNLRDVLGIENDNPLTQGVGCYLDAKIPAHFIPGSSHLNLFLADRNMKTDHLGIMSKPFPLQPNLKVISGCETITRPLSYSTDMSGEAFVDRHTPSLRIRWCWNVENKSKKYYPNFLHRS